MATNEPDNTAVRTALWRALHVELDAAPHVLEDVVGLRLAAPDPGWRDRPDMHPLRTRGARGSIVARARCIEDLLTEGADAGVSQFVLLGAGLDTIAQRRTDLIGRVRIFEIDQPDTQAWKRGRLEELGHGIPEHLGLVPVDFESGESWWDGLVDEAHRPGLERSALGAAASGTPFVSYYTPDEMVAVARDAGFADAVHVSSRALAERYFADRSDGLQPSSGEDLVVATT